MKYVTFIFFWAVVSTAFGINTAHASYDAPRTDSSLEAKK
ncbi:hypothetical protein phD2B_006 [Lelliottia phage phD2B]|uniref:Uncharacterized protein n=1 Tax=Lelliottia phage phD2B TaxID=1542498 RepID=A0A088FS18_9CAUD|nr:hypothetical protein phD2B_006 [Lelliottia phage phD2B]AIM51233.1 hypothetical protein phD2B_006 [Lelliottia phage phD2B]